MSDGPKVRIMRAGERLVVAQQNNRTYFETDDFRKKAHVDFETYASPILGVRVRFESGPRMGREANFDIYWTSATTHVGRFVFEKGNILFSDLISGEVLTVLSV